MQTACAQCLWWDDWIDVDSRHVFLQVVLVVITLEGGDAKDRNTRACSGF